MVDIGLFNYLHTIKIKITVRKFLIERDINKTEFVWLDIVIFPFLATDDCALKDWLNYISEMVVNLSLKAHTVAVLNFFHCVRCMRLSKNITRIILGRYYRRKHAKEKC